ncbi:biogenesis of lysosome- organelles complex 1 subunit bls1 [Kluyveromyces marxianus]|nr:biogenesis of lysosome- organelles complex 1 subunit bls1 [Kluyveromyces marxianus]KAG0684721.1 biogenesis of lysosome- organelles complex 1 subunit bls1 [Kluyveromyces marxianus]
MSNERILLNQLIKSKTDTVGSELLKEIERNDEYIKEVQLKKLKELHDKQFKEKHVLPLIKLYERYNSSAINDGDLQNWAELIDRDIRILEGTMDILEEEHRSENQKD